MTANAPGRSRSEGIALPLWVPRVVWALGFGGSLLLIGLAAELTPDPSGRGTHTQLGLPPCGFLQWTGLPCAGCGLTTAFAHMVRGQVVAAAAANPFGVPLFLLTLAMSVVGLLGAIRGWPVLRTLERMRIDLWALLVAASGILAWMVRLVALVTGRL